MLGFNHTGQIYLGPENVQWGKKKKKKITESKFLISVLSKADFNTFYKHGSLFLILACTETKEE